MGFYSRVIFPRLLHWGFSSRIIKKQRRQVVSTVRGDVMEVGAGSGLNLPEYPADVDTYTGLDINPGMIQIARREIQSRHFPVRWCLGDALTLPFPSNTFDVVVSTWTLCSVADASRALEEIARVLRSNGRFWFVEHGLSPDPKVQRWQRRFTPIQRRIGDGCHLDRPIARLLQAPLWEGVKLEEFYLKKCPRWIGYTYRGSAVKR